MAAGISLRQLEDECGISRGFISKMEAGRMIPTEDEYARIIAALDALAATITPVEVKTEG